MVMKKGIGLKDKIEMTRHMQTSIGHSINTNPKNNTCNTLIIVVVSHKIIQTKEEKMADPAKFKSVSVSISTYKILRYLGDGKITDADLTVSKTIESLAKKEGKKHGYKNGKA
jgi:hypothetical protein